MERPKFWILRNVQFRHICGGISFWSNFGRPKIWVFPCWVTTPHGCHWPQLTKSGRQFQQWSLFTFKQYCLKGILAKESSPRTKDFLLWSDLLKSNYWRSLLLSSTSLFFGTEIILFINNSENVPVICKVYEAIHFLFKDTWYLQKPCMSNTRFTARPIHINKISFRHRQYDTST